uniref:Putative secreted protein n=1 Tax=Ixodes ricinus TaxID=34613 RepID=A0A6B0UBT2_IXORI
MFVLPVLFVQLFPILESITHALDTSLKQLIILHNYYQPLTRKQKTNYFIRLLTTTAFSISANARNSQTSAELQPNL